MSQIQDYDLFDFDREVQPILDVLLNKSCEQAILEVEEETELTEIRKFKTEYQKRQAANQNKWEEEVEREIEIIKKKNDALHNARSKRKQEIQTMHKLQALNISKNFLRGCFMGTMRKLADNSFWRDGFKDQLNVAFNDQLLKAVKVDNDRFNKAGQVIDEMIESQLENFGSEK